MSKIELVPLINSTKFAIVDKSSYKKAMRLTWYLANSHGAYVLSNKHGFCDPLHIFLFGKAPDGLEWDHWDTNTLNNTRKNLRQVTRSQNCANRKMQRNNTSGYKGVSLYRGKWR